jgi:hypothetical protein
VLRWLRKQLELRGSKRSTAKAFTGVKLDNGRVFPGLTSQDLITGFYDSQGNDLLYSPHEVPEAGPSKPTPAVEVPPNNVMDVDMNMGEAERDVVLRVLFVPDPKFQQRVTPEAAKHSAEFVSITLDPRMEKERLDAIKHMDPDGLWHCVNPWVGDSRGMGKSGSGKRNMNNGKERTAEVIIRMLDWVWSET